MACVACIGKRGKLCSLGCDCFAHKRCLVGVCQAALKKELICAVCNKMQKMPTAQLIMALRKEIRLSWPMFYGRSGLVPYVSAEHLELNGYTAAKYQSDWEWLIDQQIIAAPSWLQKTLFAARKHQVKSRTTRCKWD